MIVTCPNCQTRYNLPDDKVPAGGAKVKCSKCGHVFKAEHPTSSPEEEVEALLDEKGKGDTQAGDHFEETFDDVAGDRGKGPETEAPVEESEESAPVESTEDATPETAATDDDTPAEEESPADEPADEPDTELPDTDDLFDETDDSDESPAAPDAGEDADDLFADEDEEDTDPGDLFGDDDDATGDDATDQGDDLFDDEDEEDGDGGQEPEKSDEIPESDLFDEDDDFEESKLSDLDESLDLDETPKKGGRKALGCLIILIILVLLVGAGVYFKVWRMVGVDVPGMLKNVPFVGQLISEETSDKAAPGESPADKVRKIELKNVKQYYVANEKEGNLFVVEGKAVNKFANPKERIKVEVSLYDASNKVLASQAFLCGNVLSQFQLQVQTQKEITDGLNSEVGILSNNTFIRPGASSPFMAVFFKPPAGVKEFMVKVVDVGDPK